MRPRTPLTDRERDCYELYVHGRMSQRAIAERLGVSQGTVCRTLKRAMEKLGRIALAGVLASGRGTMTPRVLRRLRNLHGTGVSRAAEEIDDLDALGPDRIRAVV